MAKKSDKKILITRKFPYPLFDILNENFHIEYLNNEEPLPRQTLLKLIRYCDGVVCSLNDKIDEKLIRNSKHLKIISTYSVGYDHIDLRYTRKRNIVVTNTPDVLTDSTADLTIGLLLSVARNINVGHSLIFSKKWKQSWTPNFLLGSELKDKTLGIIGYGRIGEAVAKRAIGFGMKVIYYNRIRIEKSKENLYNVNYSTLDEVLSSSDFVSIHASLNTDSFHLVNKKTLKLMKPTSYLINTSRGQLIDESALFHSLKNYDIAGAALDVFEVEPLNLRNKFLKLNNVVFTPHIGSATNEARFRMSDISARNILNFFLGKKPIYSVDS